jgi:RNA polymerase sigma-70 factor (ECF subfamily)
MKMASAPGERTPGLEMKLSILLQRCKAGDGLAWEALVRHYQARVYAIAYHCTGSAEDARDLAQETFVRMFRKLHTCTDETMFLPWMLRIARNASIDHLRRRKARYGGAHVPMEKIGELPAREGTPEQQWWVDSRKRLVHRALQQLTSLNREVILLKEIQGLRLEEIARLLRVPLGTIKSRCNRARLELARKLIALAGE